MADGFRFNVVLLHCLEELVKCARHSDLVVVVGTGSTVHSLEMHLNAGGANRWG